MNCMGHNKTFFVVVEAFKVRIVFKQNMGHMAKHYHLRIENTINTKEWINLGWPWTRTLLGYLFIHFILARFHFRFDFCVCYFGLWWPSILKIFFLVCFSSIRKNIVIKFLWKCQKKGFRLWTIEQEKSHMCWLFQFSLSNAILTLSTTTTTAKYKRNENQTFSETKKKEKEKKMVNKIPRTIYMQKYLKQS